MKKENKVKEQSVNDKETSERKYNKTDVFLSKSEEDYRTLLDTIPHGIQEIDVFGKIIFVNKAYNKIFGYEEGEVIGTSMLEKQLDDTARKTLRNYLKTLVTDQPIPTPYFDKNRTKDGRIIDVQVDWNYKRDNKGRIVGFISVLTDITEHMKNVEALKSSEEKYHKLIEHAKDAILSINQTGIIMGFNQSAEQMFGYSREEVIGKHSYLLVATKNRERQRKELENFQKAGINFEWEKNKNILEGIGVRKNGEEFPLEFSFYGIKVNGEVIATASIHDISERKKAEKELLNYQKQLKALASNLTLIEEQERRHLADCLHNEIGQHLFGIKINLQLLKDSLSSTEYATTLDNLVSNIKQVINHIRTLTVELSPPILYELGLENALEWLAEQTQSHYGIPVTFEDDKKEKTLDDDMKSFLYQAVRELLMNIAKHAQAHQATISIKQDNSSIRISVKDDGIGFNPSFEYSDYKKDAFGLFRIKERLDQFGGHLEITSQENRGTCITLVGPLCNSV